MSADAARSIHPDWSVGEREMRREVRVGQYLDGLALVTRVAHAAEAANHHPDIELGWRRVTFRLTSHDANGTVTDRDFALAAVIDGIVDELT